jgi:hypothetical protein
MFERVEALPSLFDDVLQIAKSGGSFREWDVGMLGNRLPE